MIVVLAVSLIANALLALRLADAAISSDHCRQQAGHSRAEVSLAAEFLGRSLQAKSDAELLTVLGTKLPGGVKVLRDHDEVVAGGFTFKLSDGRVVSVTRD